MFNFVFPCLEYFFLYSTSLFFHILAIFYITPNHFVSLFSFSSLKRLHHSRVYWHFLFFHLQKDLDTFHKPFFLFLIISNRKFLYSKKTYIKILTPKDSSGFLFWSFLYALQKINIVSYVYLCHQHNLYDFDLYKSLNLDVFTNYSQNHLNDFKDNVFNTFI